MKAPRFEYLKASDCAEAAQLLAQSDGEGKAVAGWQSLGPMSILRLAQPELLVDITGIAELTSVTRESASLVLGACTSHAAIEDARVPDVTQGLMPFVARGIAYRAVRNRGTMGGSLAHADPAADWVSVMALLDAQFLVAGPAGLRVVASADWMPGAFTTTLASDEILTAVRIPALSASARWSYHSFNRKPGEFAHAIAAFVDDPERGVTRGVIGATDGAPYVIDDATALLDARHPSLAAQALEAAGLAPGTYEHQVHAIVLQRASRQLTRTAKRAA